LKPESIHYCLFQNKTEGTIWKEIDDLRVFKVLDLEEIQSIFSAYQKPQVSHTNGVFTPDASKFRRASRLHVKSMQSCVEAA